MTFEEAISVIEPIYKAACDENSSIALRMAIDALKIRSGETVFYYCPCCGGKVNFIDFEKEPPIMDKPRYEVATVSETIGDLLYILKEYGDVGVYVDTPMDDTGVSSGVISVKPYFKDGYEQAMIFTELEYNMIPFFDREKDKDETD